MLIGASRARSGAYRIILQLGQNQLRLIVLRHSKTGLPEVVINDSADLTSSSFATALKQFNHSYSKLDLKKSDVTLVLGLSHYQSVSVDRPDVPTEDLAASLAFQVGELVDLAPEQMVTDYYELAYQPSGQNKVVAVVASKPQLTQFTHDILACDWKLVRITISEIELLSLHDASERAELCVYALPKGYLVQIYHRGKLCFSRALSNLRSVDEYSAEEIKLGALEPLATELQRSLDYYESQLRQAPVRTIKLAFRHAQMDTVEEALHELLAVNVERFAYESWMAELCDGDFSDIEAFAAAKNELSQTAEHNESAT